MWPSHLQRRARRARSRSKDVVSGFVSLLMRSAVTSPFRALMIARHRPFQPRTFDPVALHAQYPDLDERALQMLEPPNARYGDRGRVLASMQPGEVGDRFNQQHTVLSQSKL